ncbi:MAG: LuxR C-terminal-related transcriptional regulator [Tannerellaceae bacterium]|jgi:DNA-binding NarL/FixJ family response regulator|nr:LuxR C-terminal-related transcriptional regulator [Tannerellaceae bacterium]
MNISLKIVVAEVSSIVRSGVEVQMKRLSGFRFQLVEVARSELVHETIRTHKPDILIINPSMLVGFTLQQLKEECACPAMKCIALLYNLVDRSILMPFDEIMDIYQTNDEIKQKLDRLYAEEIHGIAENDEQQILSVREKEIVVCVVKGMTNRAIADRLFLSTHTVITHRRNIARKLQIHSASGLTVYAIVNKLIELKEIGKP